MTYKIIITKKAEKDIEKLHRILAGGVLKKIFALEHNPRPPGYKKMNGYESDRAPNEQCYRIRVGDNRIVYTIEDMIVIVTVIQVKKRGDIY